MEEIKITEFDWNMNITSKTDDLYTISKANIDVSDRIVSLRSECDDLMEIGKSFKKSIDKHGKQIESLLEICRIVTKKDRQRKKQFNVMLRVLWVDIVFDIVILALLIFGR